MKRNRDIFSYFLLIVSALSISFVIYLMIRFRHVSFEQLLFSLFYSKGSSFNVIREGILFVGIIFLFCIVILLFPFYGKVEIKKTKIFPLSKSFFLGYSIYMFFLLMIVSFLYLGVFRYVYYQINTTDLFDNYVNPREVNISFENKKNLIYIFAESFEMTNASVLNGGYREMSYITNLEDLALTNINFSGSEKLGGAVQVDGVGWTMGGMVAQTAGIPLKVIVQGNHYNEYSHFLPGAYSIGEILEKNGYRNYLMIGSDASFGGRDNYFREHGNYEILDYNWAIKNKKISKDYNIWWGYEDSRLFSFAKDKLLEISKTVDNFNFTILTADTHFPDGYIDSSCNGSLPFKNHYANSFYCSDKLISKFINWVKEQDFYKDTVIIIVGDHLTMQNEFAQEIDFNKRTVYNTIINYDKMVENDKNRLFTVMDMYPTTLAAVGANIEGDKLGLGVNLFSDKKTLVEELGYDYVNKEIGKRSIFYNKYILGNTYLEMYKNVGRVYND